MKNASLPLTKALCSVLFVLLLCAMGLTRIYAQNFTVGELNYSINDDAVSVTVTGHVNGQYATGTLTIPESVTHEGIEYSVTIIGENAFSGCGCFTGDLVIPNSVTTIDDGAFGGCTGFHGTLTLGSSLETIGDGSFSSTNNYGYYEGMNFTGDLVIPNSVTTMGGDAFAGCSALQVFDMMGRVIHSTDVVHNVFTNQMLSGVCVLRLISGNDVKTQKIVLK